jgi:hypothetical protein
MLWQTVISDVWWRQAKLFTLHCHHGSKYLHDCKLTYYKDKTLCKNYNGTDFALDTIPTEIHLTILCIPIIFYRGSHRFRQASPG